MAYVYIDTTDELIKRAIENVSYCYYELMKPTDGNREKLLDALYSASKDLENALLHPKKRVSADEEQEQTA